jgi:hypothetical protein
MTGYINFKVSHLFAWLFCQTCAGAPLRPRAAPPPPRPAPAKPETKFAP